MPNPTHLDPLELTFDIDKLQSTKDQIIALKRQTKYLHIINRFTIKIMTLNNITDIYQYVTNDVVAKLGFEDCVIYVIDHEKKILKQVAANGIRSKGSKPTSDINSLSITEGIVGHCAATEQVIVCNDTSQDQRYIADVFPALSEIAVPVFVNGLVFGVIDCENAQKNAYNQAHQEILVTVAAILSTSVQKSLAISNLEHSVNQLEYAEKLQTSLFRIASLKSTTAEIYQFYTELHQIIDSLLYAKNFFIALYDEQADVLNFPYYCDEYSDVNPDQEFSGNLLEHSLSGWVFRHQKSLLASPDDIHQMQQKGAIRLFGKVAESWLGVPFESGHVKGVVVVQSYDDQFVYHERDRELLTFVSQHVSHALDRILSEQKLQHQALHDALTGMPNRILFMDRVLHAFERSQRLEQPVIAVMYLDLDRFKNINDTLGHSVGDLFLVAVAKLIQRLIRSSDTLARLGGDEFAILLEDFTQLVDAIEVAKRIIRALKSPIMVNEHKLTTSVSIGIAFSQPHITATDLIKHADTAMYKAKEQGRATYCLFTQEMLDIQANCLRLDLEIREAINQENFVLLYQPIYDAVTEKIIAMESLVRWQHHERGLIEPAEFIGYAQESNLIVPIDHLVLNLAAQQIAVWQSQFEAGFYVSVNIAGATFARTDFVSTLVAIKNQYQLKAGILAIEITERMLVDNIEQAKESIEQIRQAGIKVLLDDFGTGFSSLSYLHQLSLDMLKIDQSFIRNIDSNGYDALIKIIITLAKSLNLKVVAEGIEEQQQYDMLQAMDCDYYQGYRFSKPTTAQQIEMKLLKQLSS